MSRKPLFPVIKLGGLAPIVGLTVFFLAGAVFALLPGVRGHFSTGGIPLWLLGIVLLLGVVYFGISIIKTIRLRRNNPDMTNWNDPSA